MTSKISAREILVENEIKNKLKDCFQKCALGRLQLKKCVDNAMNAGLSKEEILSIAEGKGSDVEQYEEASLCAVIAVGQILRYEEKHKNQRLKSNILTDNNKEEIKNKLKDCFRNILGPGRKIPPRGYTVPPEAGGSVRFDTVSKGEGGEEGLLFEVVECEDAVVESEAHVWDAEVVGGFVRQLLQEVLKVVGKISDSPSEKRRVLRFIINPEFLQQFLQYQKRVPAEFTRLPVTG